MIPVPRSSARRALGDYVYSIESFCKPSYSALAPQSLSAQPCRYQRWRATAPSRTSSSNTRQYSSKAPNSAPSPTASPSKPSSDSISEHVRTLMRRVPYPVAIITATDPTGATDTSSFRGMTVSSFSTVTLSPTPIISFNVRRPSETLNALLASKRFLVHLLAPGPDTATLARDFSKGNTTLASMLSGHGDFEFGSLDVESEGGKERPLPVLKRREGRSRQGMVDFPFLFECTLHPQKIDVNDHSVVLGSVVRVLEGGGEDGGDASDRLCLAYADTKFWKMGKAI